MMEEFVGEQVPSEEALWDLLERLLEDPTLGKKIRAPIIIGWHPELLYVPDDPLGHTVAPSTAKAILDFHKSLQRAYALLVYGQANATLLHSEDREFLDIKIYVKDGSNGLELLDSALRALIESMVSQMDGDQTLIAIIVFLALFFSSSVSRRWVSERYRARAKEIESSERIESSKEETKRAELLQRALIVAIGDRPELKNLTEESEDSKLAIVRAATRIPRSRVIGADITREEAKTLISEPRPAGKGTKIDGWFEVTEIDNQPAEGYGGKVKNMASGDEFSVDINLEFLPADAVDVLIYSLKNRASIYLRINAWLVDGKITQATIVRASKEQE